MSLKDFNNLSGYCYGIDKNKLILAQLTECAQNSTSHGLPNIARARNNLVRFIWVVCFLAMSGLCSWLILESVCEYLEYKANSKIKIVTEIPMDMPVIDICNLNAFSTQNGSDFLLQRTKHHFTANISNYHELIQRNFTYNDMRTFIQTIKSEIANPKFPEEKKKAIGLRLDEMIISCQFNLENCRLDEEFIWYYSRSFGNCFKYNTGYFIKKDGSKVSIDLKKSLVSGNKNGFQIELFVGLPQENSSKILNVEQKEDGVRLIIYNQSLLPSLTESIYAKPGVCTNIAVEKQISMDMEYPFNPCFDISTYSSFIVDYMKKANITYRSRYCRDFFIQNLTIRSCNCYNVDLPNMPNNYDPCLTEESDRCAYAVFQNFSKNRNKSQQRIECVNFKLIFL
jgi:hypothetical protein